MNVTVKKLTDVELLRRANSFTTGRDSKMSLAKAYAHQHSPIRTQIFFVELTHIPLFVASQLCRSHVGVQFFQRSKRIDRGGDDFGVECHDFGQRLDLIAENVDENLTVEEVEGITNALNEMESEVKSWPKRFDRLAPTDLAFICNAEALINMAHKRLCAKASLETREVFKRICEAAKETDPDLYRHLVPQCIYRGGICPEPRSCGFNKTELFDKQLTEYKKLFL